MVTDGDALLELLACLKARDYRFVAVTPETHARVVARPLSHALTLHDIFGWNRAFGASDIEARLLELLRHSSSLEELDGRFRSLVRVASLDDQLFLHSSFPTTAPDAVFFGPDTYRFARFVCAELSASSPDWIVDMGSGSGAGGIVAANRVRPGRLSLIDVNPAAARLARVNARSADVAAEVDIAEHVPPGCDLVIANPPYMIDTARRTYRNGGGMLGGEIACDWTRQALAALAPGGRLLLYTGGAVVGGRSPLLEQITSLAAESGAELYIEEIDPDVFGEELDRPQYRTTERIAALGITIQKP